MRDRGILEEPAGSCQLRWPADDQVLTWDGGGVKGLIGGFCDLAPGGLGGGRGSFRGDVVGQKPDDDYLYHDQSSR
jgi:hypothetical protein